MTKGPFLACSTLRFSHKFRTGSAMRHAVTRRRTVDEIRRPRPNIINWTDQSDLGDGQHPSRRQPSLAVTGNLSPLSP